ncbi:hypothetical protein Tco_1026121 [Tanacetum coccineum]
MSSSGSLMTSMTTSNMDTTSSMDGTSYGQTSSARNLSMGVSPMDISTSERTSHPWRYPPKPILLMDNNLGIWICVLLCGQLYFNSLCPVSSMGVSSMDTTSSMDGTSYGRTSSARNSSMGVSPMDISTSERTYSPMEISTKKTLTTASHKSLSNQKQQELQALAPERSFTALINRFANMDQGNDSNIESRKDLQEAIKYLEHYKARQRDNVDEEQ